jgi:hypothetical protein
MVIAHRWRLPICGHHIEHHLADSTGAGSVDSWMAQVSRSIAGNCGSAGGDDSVAAHQENGVTEAQKQNLEPPRTLKPTKEGQDLTA